MILKSLKNKSILLGISGGIAAYKAVELVRRLKDEEASVTVLMTEASKHFIAPMALEVVSQNRVYTSLFDEPLSHINLPANADLMVIAPATANVIGKFANGIADDILTTCLLSFRGPVLIAPSMNWKMYENPVFKENLAKLVSLGVIQVGPECGSLACGEEGAGRLAEVSDIVEAIISALTTKDLCSEKIVVTAGPTREYIDPVRFISNRSSGKMGYSIARAAKKRGADVVLISGPSSLRPPHDVHFIQVETSDEMLAAVKKEASGGMVLVMAAAVADFMPSKKSEIKIEKKKLTSIELRKTTDIISHITSQKKNLFVIGFAAETGDQIRNAALKMKEKGMDMIVFNDVSEPGAGFDVDTNKVTIIDKHGVTPFDIMTKDAVADAILDRMIAVKS